LKKKLKFCEFSRGNISNTKKALMTEQKWNCKRINDGFEREVPDFNPNISSSTNSGYWEQK